MNKQLLSYAARLFDVQIEHITDPEHTRNRAVVRARSALVWVLLRAHPNWTQLEIAQSIGMADRKSVYQGEKRAESLRTTDRSYQLKLDKLILIAGHQEESPPPPQRATLRITRQPDALAIWMVQARRGIYVRTA